MFIVCHNPSYSIASAKASDEDFPRRLACAPDFAGGFAPHSPQGLRVDTTVNVGLSWDTGGVQK